MLRTIPQTPTEDDDPRRKVVQGERWGRGRVGITGERVGLRRLRERPGSRSRSRNARHLCKRGAVTRGKSETQRTSWTHFTVTTSRETERKDHGTRTKWVPMDTKTTVVEIKTSDVLGVVDDAHVGTSSSLCTYRLLTHLFPFH